jgi:signal peptidase II
VPAKCRSFLMTPTFQRTKPPTEMQEATARERSVAEGLAARVNCISRWVYAAIALVVFGGDQATKSLVRSSITLHAVVPVSPHFFNLTRTQNPGAAFGLLSEAPSPWKTALLILVSVVLLVSIIGVVWKSRNIQWEAGVALSLILGGALSNLLDRLRDGRVTDFLDFYLKSYHWFTFNLADSAIVIGAGFLVIHMFTAE